MKPDCSGHDTPGLSMVRRLLKRFHPEAIPWPGSVFYNLVSSTAVFQYHYDMIARDILRYLGQGTLLDIGTGPAWLLVKLHQESPRMRLVGMDLSPAMVAQARKNMADSGLSGVIEVLEGDAGRIPFADNFFDIVVSTGSLHHWKAPVEALNEVYRVLKPGSHALMYDLVSDTPESVREEMHREFGKLRTTIFWLHSFEEPFYSRSGFEELPRSTSFEGGRTLFVGALCCLILEKGGL